MEVNSCATPRQADQGPELAERVTAAPPRILRGLQTHGRSAAALRSFLAPLCRGVAQAFDRIVPRDRLPPLGRACHRFPFTLAKRFWSSDPGYPPHRLPFPWCPVVAMILRTFNRSQRVGDRYAGKPLLRLLDSYVLWCIGELAESLEA